MKLSMEWVRIANAGQRRIRARKEVRMTIRLPIRGESEIHPGRFEMCVRAWKVSEKSRSIVEMTRSANGIVVLIVVWGSRWKKSAVFVP